MRIVSPAGILPVPQLANGAGPDFLASSRFLLEYHVRRRLAALPNLALRDRVEVVDLLVDQNIDRDRARSSRRDSGPRHGTG